MVASKRLAATLCLISIVALAELPITAPVEEIRKTNARGDATAAAAPECWYARLTRCRPDGVSGTRASRASVWHRRPHCARAGHSASKTAALRAVRCRSCAADLATGGAHLSAAADRVVRVRFSPDHAAARSVQRAHSDWARSRR